MQQRGGHAAADHLAASANDAPVQRRLSTRVQRGRLGRRERCAIREQRGAAPVEPRGARVAVEHPRRRRSRERVGGGGRVRSLAHQGYTVTVESVRQLRRQLQLDGRLHRRSRLESRVRDTQPEAVRLRSREASPQALLPAVYRGQESAEEGAEQERGYALQTEEETGDQRDTGRGA